MRCERARLARLSPINAAHCPRPCRSQDACVEVNFGRRPFQYDVAALAARERQQQDEAMERRGAGAAAGRPGCSPSGSAPALPIWRVPSQEHPLAPCHRPWDAPLP